MAGDSDACPGSMAFPHAAIGCREDAVRGALLNSDERRAARRRRREEKRAANRRKRLEGCTLDAVADAGALYKAAGQAARGVKWKASVQRYLKNRLRNVILTRRDLLEGREICRGFIRFAIYERGKLRQITSVRFAERIPQKSFTQNALIPALVPGFVHGNSANVKGRGTDYAIKLLKRHLAEHYAKHGDAGYILLVDFSDYFASIDHLQAKALESASLDDPRIVSMGHHLVDVQGSVGLGLGSEPNQILAIALPGKIDHFVHEMCGVEAYGRYMDDSYAIHADKEYLKAVLALIADRCEGLGICINWKKTRIAKLSHGFTFLKKKFSYSPTGGIVVRPCRQSIVRERRKLKKMAAMVEAGDMTMEQVEHSYQSWRGGLKHLDAHGTILSMDRLYAELFGPDCNDTPPEVEIRKPA